MKRTVLLRDSDTLQHHKVQDGRGDEHRLGAGDEMVGNGESIRVVHNERARSSSPWCEGGQVLQQWGTWGADLAVSAAANQVENPQVNLAAKQMDARQLPI